MAGRTSGRGGVSGWRRTALRQRTGLLWLVGLLTISLLGARQMLGERPSDELSVGASTPSHPTRDRSPSCEDSAVPVYCSTTSVNGRQIRYAHLAAEGGSPAAGALILDLGGPGYSLFGSGVVAQIRNGLPDPLKELDVVALEEPWVQRELSPACRTGLEAYYGTARTALEQDSLASELNDVVRDESRALNEVCELAAGGWGWSSTEYRQAVTSILGDVGLQLRGFVGLSFGSVRSAYVRDAGSRFVMLDSPAAIDISATEFLSDIEHSAIQRLEGCGTCAGSGAQLVQQMEDTWRAANEDQVQLPDRSVAFSGADVGGAALALARTPGDLAQVVDRYRSSIEGPAYMGDLSDHLWGRYGERSLSPAYLAYLDEVCSVYDGWSEGLSSSILRTEIGRFLVAFHAPCGTMERTAVPVTSSAGYDSVLWGCVVARRGDAVTPLKYAEEWSLVLPDAELHSSPESMHSSGDFSACEIREIVGGGS